MHIFTPVKISYGIILLMVGAFVPAITASRKKRSFTLWYIYGVLLFPVAVIHAALLAPVNGCIGIYFRRSPDTSKHCYKRFHIIKRPDMQMTLTVKVFFRICGYKLLSGVIFGITLFAMLRTFLPDTLHMRIACTIFAVCFSALMAIVQFYRLSKLAGVLDEVSRRTLYFICTAAVSSVPMYLIMLVFSHFKFPNMALISYLCIVASFIIFLTQIIQRQMFFGDMFFKFFDYCVISLTAYACFTAIVLVMISLFNGKIVDALTMQSQLFNTVYTPESLSYSFKISDIYKLALSHGVIFVIMLLSGIVTLSHHTKELQNRIEYRTRSVRMSKKNILRRHIPSKDSHNIKPVVR